MKAVSHQPVAVAAAALAWLGSATASAAPGSGTLGDPIIVDAMPYALAHTTVGAPSDVIDSYSCAPSVDESGPERVFRFALASPARVTAWVEGDGGGVDIDVHLLDDAELTGGEAASCLARDNVIAEANMAAGEHYAVVDSYDGAAQAGPFVLRLEAIGEEWIERPVATGVRWRARRFEDLHGQQVVHALVVDLAQNGVEIRAIASSGCQTVGQVGAAAVALGGVNGGYFGGGCAPVSLLIASGSWVGSNSVTRGAFGLSQGMQPMVELVAAGQNWPAAYEAHGGGPILVEGGTARQGSAAWDEEGFSGSFLGDHPRTFAGIDAAGRVHMLTVDGRRANADGLSLDELAAFAASSEVGLVEAVNLDGGGSTTMWIDGATPNGVVNYPSDASQEQQDHPGSRANSGGLFVFAPPSNHPPRFQTTPPTQAAVGSVYAYDADAIDLDVTDVVSFSLTAAPEGMSIDGDCGELDYAPEASAPPSALVVIVAADGRGAQTEQSYALSIEGGMGAAGAGGGAAGGVAGGAAGGAAGDGGASLGASGIYGSDEGGCRLGWAGTAFGWSWALALVLLALPWAVRRSAPRWSVATRRDRQGPARPS